MTRPARMTAKLRRHHRGKVAETRARGQFGKSIALRSYARITDVRLVIATPPTNDEPGSIWLTRRGLLKLRADIDRHLKEM